MEMSVSKDAMQAKDLSYSWNVLGKLALEI